MQQCISMRTQMSIGILMWVVHTHIHVYVQSKSSSRNATLQTWKQMQKQMQTCTKPCQLQWACTSDGASKWTSTHTHTHAYTSARSYGHVHAGHPVCWIVLVNVDISVHECVRVHVIVNCNEHVNIVKKCCEYECKCQSIGCGVADWMHQNVSNSCLYR